MVRQIDKDGNDRADGEAAHSGVRRVGAKVFLMLVGYFFGPAAFATILLQELHHFFIALTVENDDGRGGTSLFT